jgi:hypothetical protein
VTLIEIIAGLVDEASTKRPVVRPSEVVEGAMPHLREHPALAEELMREGLHHRIKNHIRRRNARGAA